MTSFLFKLQNRGCLQDVSNFDELSDLLQRQKIRFYCGFDPTSDSLHVGSMIPLLLMRRLQHLGHQPIAIIGTATGMIGDPSGKSEERKLLQQEIIEHNASCLREQVLSFFSSDRNTASSADNSCIVLANHSWLDKLNLLEFLRDVGKFFSVNTMIARDSVHERLHNRDQGISYTEFSYMLLQAYDFYWLHQNYQCRLQVGGSDQWGNIAAGLEFIRRKTHADPNALSTYGMTFPLLKTSTGTKFGKTEQGTVWLDRNKTSSYRFYQYWYNTADDDVMHYLRLFTELAEEEISVLGKALRETPEKRQPQQRLAQVLTEMIHGASDTQRAIEASSVLFGSSLKNISLQTLLEIFGEVPSTSVSRANLGQGLPIGDILVETKLADSKGAARRLIDSGGIYLNNERVQDNKLVVAESFFIEGQVLLLRSGKKNYHLLRLNDS